MLMVVVVVVASEGSEWQVAIEYLVGPHDWKRVIRMQASMMYYFSHKRRIAQIVCSSIAYR